MPVTQKSDYGNDTEGLNFTSNLGFPLAGGDVEFIDFNDGIVTVRMKGACGNCPMSMMTLKQGIEARMKAAIPEVQAVEQI